MARDYTRYTVKGLGENLNKKQPHFRGTTSCISR